MKSLQYIIHALGDVFQPLHVGRLSDLSGSSIKNVWDGDFGPMTLHQVWDTALFVHSNREADMSRTDSLGAACRAFDKMLQANPPLDSMSCLDEPAGTRDLTTDVDSIIKSFALESAALAHQYAYYEVDGTNVKSGTKLTKEYIAQRAVIAEKLVIRAGSELACYLRDLAFHVRGNKGRRYPISFFQERLENSSLLFKACGLMKRTKVALDTDSNDAEDLMEKEFEMKHTLGLANINKWPVDTW